MLTARENPGQRRFLTPEARHLANTYLYVSYPHYA